MVVKKTQRQLFLALTRDRCDRCGRKDKEVIHFDRRTASGKIKRTKWCTSCYFRGKVAA